MVAGDALAVGREPFGSDDDDDARGFEAPFMTMAHRRSNASSGKLVLCRYGEWGSEGGFWRRWWKNAGGDVRIKRGRRGRLGLCLLRAAVQTRRDGRSKLHKHHRLGIT